MSELRPFGLWLKTKRQEKGLSQRRLGELVEVDRSHISQIESGKILIPAPSLRQRIYQVLGGSDRELRHAGYLAPAGTRLEDASTVTAPDGHLRVSVWDGAALPTGADADTVRQELHALIDALPDGALGYTMQTLRMIASQVWLEAPAEPSDAARR